MHFIINNENKIVLYSVSFNFIVTNVIFLSGNITSFFKTGQIKVFFQMSLFEALSSTFRIRPNSGGNLFELWMVK